MIQTLYVVWRVVVIKIHVKIQSILPNILPHYHLRLSVGVNLFP